jgi:hypothetical protein
MRNNFDKDIWVKSAKRKIEIETSSVAISDVRFLNEVEAVRDMKGYIIKVTRPDAGATGGISGHPSETELQNFNKYDFLVHNDGSFEDLHIQLDNIYDKIINNEICLQFSRIYKEMLPGEL